MVGDYYSADMGMDGVITVLLGYIVWSISRGGGEVRAAYDTWEVRMTDTYLITYITSHTSTRSLLGWMDGWMGDGANIYQPFIPRSRH